MPNNESKSVAPITLTAEQIISLVGHGVTQEQLDSVRRELGEKMDNQDIKFDAKFDKLDAKIDSKFNLVLGFLLANIAGIVALGFWLGQNVMK